LAGAAAGAVSSFLGGAAASSFLAVNY